MKLRFNLDVPSPALLTVHGLSAARSDAADPDWPCHALPAGAIVACDWQRPALGLDGPAADPDYGAVLVLQTEGFFRGGAGAARDVVRPPPPPPPPVLTGHVSSPLPY
jgi:hypothetical protein